MSRIVKLCGVRGSGRTHFRKALRGRRSTMEIRFVDDYIHIGQASRFPEYCEHWVNFRGIQDLEGYLAWSLRNALSCEREAYPIVHTHRRQAKALFKERVDPMRLSNFYDSLFSESGRTSGTWINRLEILAQHYPTDNIDKTIADIFHKPLL